MKYLLSAFVLLFSLNAALAQNKVLAKAEKAYIDGNLGSANNAIDKCLKDKDNKNNVMVYLLKSKIMLGISKDKNLYSKYPGALKDALKYGEKAMILLKSADMVKYGNDFVNHFQVLYDEDAYFKTLLKISNKEAMESYDLNKYAKALPMFRRSLAFSNDTQAQVLMADCYWQLGQKAESVPMFKNTAEMIYAAVLDSNSKVYGYQKEPFRKLCLYYISIKAYDSAYLIVKNGREIFPNDPVLNDYTYGLLRYNLEKIPPSIDYLNAIKMGLKDFPADSFLNHRENSIYIYLLNSLAIEHQQKAYDSLMTVFCKTKLEKAKLNDFYTVQRFDAFAGKSVSECESILKSQFKNMALSEACYALWMHQNAASINANKVPELGFQSAIMSEADIQMAEYVFNNHMALNPKQRSLIAFRAKYTQSKFTNPVKFYDLLSMIHLCDSASKYSKTFEFQKQSVNYRLQLLSQSIDSNEFYLFRDLWPSTLQMCKASIYVAQNKTLQALWQPMIEKDFKINYFGSRVNTGNKTEAGIPTYQWNGYADSCIAGSMPKSVMESAERRVNYFRRTAGLNSPVVFTIQNNAYCMSAALMCEANKSMSHEPSDGWRCYIPAGLDALKQGIISKDGNPAIAITAAMGQNHPSVGNRRWLLSPKTQYMGIGTSKTYSVIYALDQSRLIDSNQYKNQFIAWPPAKDCPKMLIFKKWSFSIDSDLKGAVVEMQDAQGNPIELKQEAVVNGYGMNTLVWEPTINLKSLDNNSSFKVNITLANKASFQYLVNVIDIP